DASAGGLALDGTHALRWNEAYLVLDAEDKVRRGRVGVVPRRVLGLAAAGARQLGGGGSTRSHMACCSQYFVAPTEKPSATSNHFANCSLPWSHLRKSFASFTFFPYRITACEKATW